jgi:hypothetical protein
VDYADALAEYARGCCPCALPALERVVEGDTEDPPEAVQRAQLLLGVCLADTGWPLAAVSVLDTVTRTPAHPYAGEAFRELSRLAPSLPDPAVLVDTFRGDDEVRLADEDPTAASAAAAYLQGRARYDDGDFEAASRLFGRVPPSSTFFLPSRFYQGTSAVRLRHARAAVIAFEDVERVGRAAGSRYADLAALALARLYYAVANGRHDAGDDAAAAARMEAALAAWRRVPVSSEHFLDAFFEESWALTLAGQDERALGHVFGLLSPFFEDHEHPEAFVVRGTIYFQHCDYGHVDRAVSDFHARFDGPLADLARLRDAAADDDVARAIHDGTFEADAATRRMIRDALVDRDVGRRIAHEDAARAELGRVAGSVHGGHRLGARLEQELGLTVAFAHVRVGDAVRTRLGDAYEALRDRANEVDTIALETATARRDVVTGHATLAESGLREEREAIASEGVEYWPFDGEYWQDEVTSYRVVVNDYCGR